MASSWGDKESQRNMLYLVSVGEIILDLDALLIKTLTLFLFQAYFERTRTLGNNGKLDFDLETNVLFSF